MSNNDTTTIATNRKPLSLLFIIISVLIPGLLWYLGNDLYGRFWFCMWLAPAPLLIAVYRVKKWWLAYIIAYVAYAIGRLSWFGYITAVVNARFALQLVLTLPLLFAVWIIITRAIVRKTNAWYSVFAYPVFISLSEFIMMQTSHDGSTSSIVYTQMNFLPVIQVASVTGLLGITFIISLIPSAIATGIYFYNDKSKFKPLLITASACVVIVVGFGLIRLANIRSSSTIKAGIVALNEKEHIISKQPDFAKSLQVTNLYADAIGRLADSGARIVLIPERALNINDSINIQTLSVLQQTAKQHHTYIAAAYTNFKEAKPHNSILIIDDAGNLLVDYNKQHMVSFWEDWFTPGHTTGLFNWHNLPAGVAICKDLDFPATINQYGKAGVGVMVIPAWDFEVDDWLHGRMATLRGVENGFSEIRAARQGRLTISDAYGRILYETSTAKGEAATVLGAVPVDQHATLYSKYGDWFGILICIAAVYFLLLLGLKKAGSVTNN